MKLFFSAMAAALCVALPAHATYPVDWSNTCTTWHFNPQNVRDPNIVYNVTTNTVNTCPGYDGTVYAITPCNFAPTTGVPPAAWTRIGLGQFTIPNTAKELIITGHADVSDTSGYIYVWFRAAGSTWNLSPITISGLHDGVSYHVPVGHVDNAPAIDMAWETLGSSSQYALNLVISGWCE